MINHLEKYIIPKYEPEKVYYADDSEMNVEIFEDLYSLKGFSPELITFIPDREKSLSDLIVEYNKDITNSYKNDVNYYVK